MHGARSAMFTTGYRNEKNFSTASLARKENAVPPIKIIHISDLHISEHLTRGADKNAYLPHRYGHDVQAFLALDLFLKNHEWDLLLITGDVSRIGNKESFEWVRNWLENEILFGATKVGLNLSKSNTCQYLIIPGNHDRFNGKLKQGSLDQYHQEFPVVRSGSTKSLIVNGQAINVHFFDSTTADGGFAYGEIDQRSLIPKTLRDEDIDLALLHHHFLQPPKHPREISTELTNSSEVAAYMLNTGFDGIFFGHTHKGYIGRPSVEILGGLLNDKRKCPRFWTRFVPKFVLRQTEDDCLVSYKREAAKNGQLPTLQIYFDFLYLSQKGHKLRGPSSFNNIRDFYSQMSQISIDKKMGEELSKAKTKKVLISLAPSACQAEAEWKGFHVVEITRDDNSQLNFAWDRFEFDGAEFKKKPRDLHVS